jgi:murein DD-endopeptidase MepM/ murein hydrolase activator NlpD
MKGVAGWRRPETIADHVAAGAAFGLAILVGMGGLVAWPRLLALWPAAVLEGLTARPAREPSVPAAPSFPAMAVGPSLLFPVPAVAGAPLRDSFADRRGPARLHGAIDIPAPLGSPVLAVDDGTVTRLTRSGSGGIAVYHVDAGARYGYYYAHLQRHAYGLAEGQRLRRGQVVGYVGATGNAARALPHLHFAMYELSSGQFRGARAMNPLALWRATPEG